MNAQLVLTVRSNITAGTYTVASFGLEVGIAVPHTGVRLNQASLTISATYVRDGPVLPTLIHSTQPVGSFTDSTTLSYSPGSAGDVSNITVSFRPEMPITAGDTVQVLLENFTGNSNSDIPIITSPPGILGQVEWNETVQIMSMPFQRNVSMATSITVLVLEGAGVALPKRGCRHDSTGN
jgi:hypothetical protein